MNQNKYGDKSEIGVFNSLCSSEDLNLDFPSGLFTVRT